MWFIPEVIGYLTEHLGFQVSTVVPEHRPKKAVTVVQTGGSGDRFTERPSLTIHAWGTSELEALTLINQVADAMLYIADDSQNIARCEQESIYTNPYTDGAPRWSANFSFVINR